MAEDDFDLYGEEDNYRGQKQTQSEVGSSVVGEHTMYATDEVFVRMLGTTTNSPRKRLQL